MILFEPIGHPTFCKIVGSHLDRYAVADQHADTVLAHPAGGMGEDVMAVVQRDARSAILPPARSEEHTSELQSLMRISYAVFCLKKKKHYRKHTKSKRAQTERYTIN